MKKLFMVLLTAFVMVGCGSSDSSSDNSSADEYTFKANDVTIQMNDDASSVVESLGKEIDYFEAPSCAFEGIDKTYTYAGFQLVTYPKDDKDYVCSVELKDDTVATQEGVCIGDSKAKVDETYGTDRDEENNAYTYTKGKSTLKFIFDGDTIISIIYNAITD